MNWFVSATDTKQKAFFSWTAIVVSALPVLVIAPVYTLPHQAIEDGIVGTRFGCKNTTLFELELQCLLFFTALYTRQS